VCRTCHLHHVHWTQSKAFAFPLPEDNRFVRDCAPYGPPESPAGVYSPAVDDGIYVRLNPLQVSHTPHILKIYGELLGGGFVVDVTYHLTVVPVATE